MITSYWISSQRQQGGRYTMIDIRFPTALHLMLSLALAHAEGVAQLSSAQLANGLGANPSLVRKLLVPLANAGLVHATYGRDGGIRLGAALGFGNQFANSDPPNGRNSHEYKAL